MITKKQAMDAAEELVEYFNFECEIHTIKKTETTRQCDMPYMCDVCPFGTYSLGEFIKLESTND